MKNWLSGFIFALSVPACSFAADITVSQPYRPVNQVQQWTIEGQSYGLLKVRVLINGEKVAEGPMKDANFNSTYEGHPVRVSCAVGHVRFSGPADQSCSVYVNNELAANLVWIRR